MARMTATPAVHCHRYTKNGYNGSNGPKNITQTQSYTQTHNNALHDATMADKSTSMRKTYLLWWSGEDHDRRTKGIAGDE